MIIGLTGRNCSGKGEVAGFLKESGYEYHSLSDILREELAARGKKVTREALIAIGNEMRQAHGAGALAERTLAKLSPEAHAIVDSIRNPVEVEVLRRRRDFRLVSVEADPRVRFERMKGRGRESDPATFEQFLEYEARESRTPDPTTQQLDLTAELADAVIRNDGTVEDLKGEIRRTMKSMAASSGRPSWDEYFMDIARVVALRGNCIKRKIAAVIVRDRRIISTGYNGTPRGIKNCNEGGCPRCNSFGASGENLDECLCSHAEENAIVQAAYHGVSIKGGTIYTTYSPCLICTKMIINSGLAEVVYDRAYTIAEVPLKLLKEAGVKARQIESRDPGPGTRKPGPGTQDS
ncbi:MAG: AAA family ATPase [Proteobacteria bacterium]|nr:AAA family ATPase [Pseudomonadota bacterium]